MKFVGKGRISCRTDFFVIYICVTPDADNSILIIFLSINLKMHSLKRAMRLKQAYFFIPCCYLFMRTGNFLPFFFVSATKYFIDHFHRFFFIGVLRLIAFIYICFKRGGGDLPLFCRFTIWHCFTSKEFPSRFSGSLLTAFALATK